MSVNQAQAISKVLKTMPTPEMQRQRKPQTFFGRAIQSIRKDKITMSALGFLFIMALVSALATPITATFVGVDPNHTNPANQFAKPYIIPYIQWRLGTDMETAPILLGQSDGVPHWLGTDQLGRDQFARLLYGGRVSLSIAFFAAAIALLIGVSIGTMAGYFGGVVDDIIMWTINTLVSIPTIYLLIIVVAIFSPNTYTLTAFLGLVGWFGTARLMRGNVFKVRELDYTLAARAIGASNLRIMVQHVVPNSIPVIIIATAIAVGNLILTESVLSFLGLGIQPPTATWGNMLSRARTFLFLVDPETQSPSAIHLLIWPGLLITLTVLSFYLIGDGLRDALDPTMKREK